jgi:hypothetical protein
MKTTYRLATVNGKELIVTDEPKNWTSLSPVYSSKEELMAGEKITGTCECGSLIRGEKDACFRCRFWEEKENIGKGRHRLRVVRIQGEHYMIAEDNPSAAFQGCGGRKFTILFYDGRRVETKNLWCQGTIPHHFRSRLPDNAVFGE